MERARVVFENICVKTVLLIGAALFFVFAFWAARYTHDFPRDLTQEKVYGVFDSIPRNLLWGAGVLALSGPVQALLLRGSRERKRRRVFWLALADMALVGAFLAYWVGTGHFMPDSDQLQVYYDALAFRRGDYSDMRSYLEMYPHQYGLIFLYEGLLGIWESYRFLEYLNIPLVLLILFLTYRIADDFFEEPAVSLYALAGVTCFAPLIYYVSFVYGDVCSVAMGLAGIWSLHRYLESRKSRYGLLAVLTVTAAVLVRKNTLVLVTAACIVLAVYALRHLRWQALLLALLLAVIPLGSVRGVEWIYEKRSGQEIGGGIPSIMWVAMGMQESWGGAGVYNGYNNSVFRGQAGSDPQAASAIAGEYIRGRLQEFAADRDMAYEFYRFKLLEQWNESTFGGLIMTHYFDAPPGRLVQSAYAGEIQQGVLHFMNRYLFVLYLGGFLFAALGLFRRWEIGKCLPLIGVIGGVLFSLIWEAKGRYVMPYAVMLIPYMAAGGYYFQRSCGALFRRWTAGIRRGKNRRPGSGMEK